MAQKALYDLQLQMTANSAELVKGLKESNKKLDGFKQEAEKSMAKVKTAFATAAVIIGTLKGALETVKTGMTSTGKGADDLTRSVNSLKGGFQELAGVLVSGDWENIVGAFIRGARAAANFTNEMDLMDTRLSDLQLLKSKVEGEVAMLKVKKNEGTITTEELNRLKKQTEELQLLEVQIYNRGINALIENMAKSKGLTEEQSQFLKENLEKGIEERARYTDEEWKELSKSTKNFSDYVDALKKKYTEIEYFNPGGDSMPIEVATTNMEKVNEELFTYLQTLSGAELAEVTENLFGSPEKWIQLINFLTTRNDLTREYGRLEGRVSTYNTGQKGEKEKPIYETPINIPAGIATIPKIAEELNTSLIQIKATTKEIFDYVGVAGQILYDAFRGLEGVLVEAFTTPEATFADFVKSFGKMMKQLIAKLIAVIAVAIIAAAILSLIPGLGVINGLSGASKGVSFGMAVGANLKSLMGMKDGGLVYGNSIVNVGEYPGARSNPEVIAPLDKLQSIIGNSMMGGEVVFRIEGTELVGILNKQNKINSSY